LSREGGEEEETFDYEHVEEFENMTRDVMRKLRRDFQHFRDDTRDVFREQLRVIRQ
jgi:hypothetical protein